MAFANLMQIDEPTLLNVVEAELDWDTFDDYDNEE